MGRSVVTTLGICVSVAMITAVFVAAASFLNLIGDISLFSTGRYEAIVGVDSYKQYQKLKSDERIKQVGASLTPKQNGAYKVGTQEAARANVGMFVFGDSDYFSQCVTCDFDGTLPQKKDEIAVEQDLIEKNNLGWKIGDIVTVEVGTRTFKEKNGSTSVVSGAFTRGERFEKSKSKKYKITAILHQNNPTYSWGTQEILCFMDESMKKSGGFDATIDLAKLNHNSLKQVRQIISDYGFEQFDINNDYLETFLAADEDGFLVKSLLPCAAVVLVLIIVASVALVYNAFAMSLSERVRYLGMLASVGATKKQKRKSIYYEGFLLGAIGIPIGIVAGIGGIAITLRAVGSKIIESGMIEGVSESNIKMKTVVSPLIITLIVLFAVITIFISSFVPAKKASAITPIDAIRQRNEVSLKAKRLKTPRIIRLIFGYEGELAHKSIKRNARKTRVIVTSITLCMVLFFACNYFCSVFMQANANAQEIPYQISVGVDYGSRNELREQIEQIQGVEKIYSVNNDNYYLGSNGDPYIENGFKDKKNLTAAYKNLYSQSINLYVNYLEDSEFNALCKRNSIDSKKFYDKKKNNCIVLNNISHKEGGTNVFSKKMLGQKFARNDKDEPKYSFALTFSDFVAYDKDDFVLNINPKNCISLYVPESLHKTELRQSGYYQFAVVTNDHEGVAEQIDKAADSLELENFTIVDSIEAFSTMNAIVFVVKVFVYGFIALISLITVANIINTISTGIILRKKEFAMLKSVGTTPRGFNKMIVLESAFYALRAVVFAIPISVGLNFLLNKMIGEASIPYVFDFKLYLLVTVVVFAVVGLTMLYSVGKLKNDSIVETLKQEIN